MEKSVINVEGMSCEHCAMSVKKALGALPGVSGVDVDLEAGTVTVQHDPALAALDRLKSEIQDQGFDA